MKAMGDTALGKVQAGDEFFKEGVAFTKKTFTRWKPDWVAAVLAFEQAVKQYKLAKNKEKLIDANVQLAGAQCEVGSFYNAGNALVAAAELMSELGNIDAAVPTYEQAHQRFLEASSGKEAGSAMLKCGKALEKTDPDRAETYFTKAMATYQEEEAFLHARECYDYVVRYYIGAKKWPQALATLDKQIDLGIALDASSISCKAGLGMCIIHLCNDEARAELGMPGDYPKAIDQENILRAGRIEGWLASSERTYLRKMLNAWEIGNQEMADAAGKDCSLCLTGELVRMVKKIKVPEDGEEIEDEPAPDGGDDDDDPDGIC